MLFKIIQILIAFAIYGLFTATIVTIMIAVMYEYDTIIEVPESAALELAIEGLPFGAYECIEHKGDILAIRIKGSFNKEETEILGNTIQGTKSDIKHTVMVIAPIFGFLITPLWVI